jgi:cell division transport system permease protein
MACLLIVGCAAMVILNIESMLDIVEGQNVIMVYVKDEASEYETSVLKVELERTANVSEVIFIPREQAFEEQLKKLGDGAEYLGALDASILPNAYKVKISDMAKFTETVNEIKGYQNILRIRESGDLANKLIVIRSSVTYVSIGLVALLFIVAIFIVANTVRITMFSRRLEISIMKAVGATNSFIRFPFMVEGVLLGIISGVFSLTIVWGLYELAASVFTNLLSVIGGTPVPFTRYALHLLFGFVLVGVFTGSFGSAFSMGKYLKEQGSVVCDE